ncbi:ABC transporter permease [Nocardioides halotolerans]|uniref:ABC transporter permease n=1 Tax=Nocardioides halotolerans TaxID=433660 RepID=UPI00040B561C|nr:ABC transporter permease [Nocardioides halotolerans]
MLRYVVRRAVSGLLVLFFLIAALFVLQHLSPADPVRALVGNKASPEAIENARHQLGYDRPLLVQFWSYLGDLAHLDLQTSLRTKHAVSIDVLNTLGPTVELLAFSALLAFGGGFLLGLLTLRGGRVASGVRMTMIATASVPPFLLALLLIILLYSRADLFPATGQTSIATAPTGPTRLLVLDSLLHGQPRTMLDALHHLVLPGLTLAATPAVAIGRAFSSALTTTMRADFVKTARMKGLSNRQFVTRHVLRNCLNSALAMGGLQLGVMLAAVTIIESMFAWPGVGQYLALSIGATDLPAILAVALVFGAFFITVNTLVDIGQALADPRIALNA